jgi:putative peptidoglycan lipid II flippase
MAMLAQAAGAASMPFFASLSTRDRHVEFASSVVDSVSRVASLGLLAASCMIALGRPAIDLVMTGGRFSAADSRLCAFYFAVFSVSLFLWSAQAIYARAFYAAGNTFVPMVASTIVTLVSLPVYALLDRSMGMTGLALASNIGIALQTLTIAALLHKRRMVSLAGLDYRELARCLFAAIVAGGAAWLLAWAAQFAVDQSRAVPWLHHTRWNDAAILAAGILIWIAIVKVILEKTGSALPRVALKKLRLA